MSKCSWCCQAEDHSDDCPYGEVERLAAKVAEVEKRLAHEKEDHNITLEQLKKRNDRVMEVEKDARTGWSMAKKQEEGRRSAAKRLAEAESRANDAKRERDAVSEELATSLGKAKEMEGREDGWRQDIITAREARDRSDEKFADVEKREKGTVRAVLREFRNTSYCLHSHLNCKTCPECLDTCDCRTCTKRRQLEESYKEGSAKDEPQEPPLLGPIKNLLTKAEDAAGRIDRTLENPDDPKEGSASE